MPFLSRGALLSLGAAVALSGCANISGSSTSSASAPAAASALPTAVASLVKTDVGQYFATPRAGMSAKDIQATIDRLKAMPGVQSATLDKDGRVDLQFLGRSTAAERTAAVKQLAAIGKIDEGV